MIKRLLTILLAVALVQASAHAQIIRASAVNMTQLSNAEALRGPLTGAVQFYNSEEDEDPTPIPLIPAPPSARVFSSAPESNRLFSTSDESNNVQQRMGRTSTVQTFQGVNDDSYFDLVLSGNFLTIPPDVMGAVGVNHVMTVHNNKYRVTNKSGTQLTYVDAQAFWNGTTGYGTGASQAKRHSDPHVLYNHYLNRWMLIAQSDLDAGSALMVAMSTSNDPTGTWNRYVIDIDATNTNGFDYPLLGFNQQWLVVTGNLFPLAGGSAVKHQIYIFDIANLAAGGGLVFSGGGETAQLIEVTQAAQSGWSAPCTVFESGAPTNGMTLLQPFWSSGGNTAIRMTTLTGTIPSVTWNTGAAVFITSGISNYSTSMSSNNVNSNFTPQAVDQRKVCTNDGRLCNSVMVNGKLWTAQHIFLPAGSTTNRSAIQWWQLSAAGAVLQNGRIDDPNGVYQRSFPSIAVNSAEDVLVGYTLASANSFVSSAYSVRKACTPANKMEYEVVYKAGIDWYFKDFAQGTGRGRWGDYSSTCVDPSNGHLWTVQEYAATRTSSADNGSHWGS